MHLHRIVRRQRVPQGRQERQEQPPSPTFRRTTTAQPGPRQPLWRCLPPHPTDATTLTETSSHSNHISHAHVLSQLCRRNPPRGGAPLRRNQKRSTRLARQAGSYHRAHFAIAARAILHPYADFWRLLRKTGIVLQDTGERDEHGFENPDIFSSPEKGAGSPADDDDDEEDSGQEMELDDGMDCVLSNSYLSWLTPAQRTNLGRQRYEGPRSQDRHYLAHGHP